MIGKTKEKKSIKLVYDFTTKKEIPMTSIKKKRIIFRFTCLISQKKKIEKFDEAHHLKPNNQG